MALLEVRDITKSFGKTDVLKGISFDLEEGNVLSISARREAEKLHFCAA